jgi:hypothetical protein
VFGVTVELRAGEKKGSDALDVTRLRGEGVGRDVDGLDQSKPTVGVDVL